MSRTLANPKIFLWPILVVCIHIIATVLGWYDYVLWLDTPMHFLGGAAIALSTYYYIEQEQIPLKKLQILFVMISVTGLSAIIWEFIEFSGDYFFLTVMQPDLPDTMKDLAMGLLGSIVIGTIMLLKRKNRS